MALYDLLPILAGSIWKYLVQQKTTIMDITKQQEHSQSASHSSQESGSDSQLWAALSDWELNEELESELADRIQATFESVNQKQMIYRGALPKEALFCFARQVAAHPENLSAHVKRFYLAMLNRSKEKVLGALIDLIIILRFKGDTLTSRLIGEAEPLLGQDAVEQLRGILKDKSAKRVLDLDVSESVLVNGRSLPAVYKKGGVN